jgi:CHAT domain-containing protein
MKQIFPRFTRILALAMSLCVCAVPGFAMAADKDWQALVAEYLVLEKQGDYVQALKLAQKATALAEPDLNKNPEKIIVSLLFLGSSNSYLGQHEKALPIKQRALSISEKAFGQEGTLTGMSLHTLAVTYSDLGQFDKALPLQQRALLLIEKTLGHEHPDIVPSLNNLGTTYGELGQHDKVLPLHQRALAIREKSLSPNDRRTSQSLLKLANTYSALGQYDQALPLQQRALVISEITQGPEHPETAARLNDLAETYRALAQYDQALSLHQRALAIREKALGPTHPDTGNSLSELAETYRDLAQYDQALPLGQRALAISEKTEGPEHPETATSLNNLAETYRALAQYDQALPLHQRALAIRKKALGPTHPVTANSLNNLALIHRNFGQHDKALLLQQRALAIYEQSLGSQHTDTAFGLNYVAGSHIKLFEYGKALPLQLRALSIFEKTLGPEHPHTATCMSNLAITYNALAQREKGLAFQQRALVIREKNLEPGHPDIAYSLHNLAATHSFLGQHNEALLLNSRALAIFEKNFGTAHPLSISSLEELALTLIRMGHPDLAISFLKSAVNAHQNQRQQISRIDADAIQSYTESVAGTYQTLAALLVDQGLLPDAQLVLDMLKENEQFEFIRRSSSADPRLTRIGYNSTEQIWMTRYRQIADRLVALGVEEQALQKQAKLGLSAEQKQRQQGLASDLRVAQTAFELFLKEMRESFARQGPSKAAEVSATSLEVLRELQGLLKGIGHDAVLLQYYVTDDKVGMLLTTQGVQLARSANVSAKDLNRQIAEFRRLLRDPKSDAVKTSQALYQLLVAPVAQDLEQAGAKTVMLSLDGALRYLPFGALHDGQRYLIQRWNLPMYTSVTRNRLRDATSPTWQAAGLGVTRALGEFTALPAVKAEMRSIIKASGGGVLPGEVYLDEAFTAQRFKDVSQRSFQLLHVASHFRFSPGTEVNSFLLLGDGQQLTLGDIRMQNYRFDNVDLLTLSACDTGLGGGRDAQGREIEGFGVIAQQQGAKAVLATLWPVADESTATLMAEMYRRRQEQHLTKIEALRQAQLSLLAQSRFAHPFHWAPFILMGNWK